MESADGPGRRQRPAEVLPAKTMIKRSLMTEIALNCRKLDQIALRTYRILSGELKDKPAAAFFRRMAADEERHIAFWDRLIDLAAASLIPDIFNQPEDVLRDLSALAVEVEELAREAGPGISLPRAFFIAFKLEFYVLHPALGMLFHYVKGFDDHPNPEDDYHRHIDALIRAVQECRLNSPEMELMGKALQKLWAANKKLADRIAYDALTGILNRKGFFDTITPLCHLSARSGHRVAFFMIDIDDFKRINDIHGHRKGDRLLGQVARTIKNNIRKSDIAGRYGGEEFVVFLSNIKEHFVLETAEKIRSRIETIKVGKDRVTVSIGISHGTLGVEVKPLIDTYLQQADFNLYKAKKQGKNQIVA